MEITIRLTDVEGQALRKLAREELRPIENQAHLYIRKALLDLTDLTLEDILGAVDPEETAQEYLRRIMRNQPLHELAEIIQTVDPQHPGFPPMYEQMYPFDQVISTNEPIEFQHSNSPQSEEEVVSALVTDFPEIVEADEEEPVAKRGRGRPKKEDDFKVTLPPRIVSGKETLTWQIFEYILSRDFEVETAELRRVWGDQQSTNSAISRLIARRLIHQTGGNRLNRLLRPTNAAQMLYLSYQNRMT